MTKLYPTPPPQTTEELIKTSSRRQATEADMERFRIPQGYNLGFWDPNEQPLLLAGMVFDTYSLGRWIWLLVSNTNGKESPLAQFAGYCWELLIDLSGRIKLATVCLTGAQSRSDKGILRYFKNSGCRLLGNLQKLLRTCESSMPSLERGGLLSQEKATMFVDTLFGRDGMMGNMEELIERIRIWVVSFEESCDPVIKTHTPGTNAYTSVEPLRE